jgi:hypothetical protein
VASSLLVFRTIELGREDAKPAFLENLNPAGMSGPEGIQFDDRGNLYIGDSRGIIRRFQVGGIPALFADLGRVREESGAPDPGGLIRVGGIAIDSAGDLYVAAYGYAGGSVLRVDGVTRQVRLFARDIGVAGAALVSGDGNHLWVSDHRRSGRILRYPIGPSLPAQPDLVLPGLASPGGIALGNGGTTLYAAETYSGDIVCIDLAAAPPSVSHIADLKGAFAIGSLTGLAFDPRDTRRRFLYVAENLRGIFTILDLQASPVRAAKQIRLAQMGGRPCPAFMVIRDGYLYFTDLWSCSPVRLLLRMPEYREHAYRFQVTDLGSAY